VIYICITFVLHDLYEEKRIDKNRLDRTRREKKRVDRKRGDWGEEPSLYLFKGG